MKRPGYREAILWLAGNDDNEWLENEYGRIDGEPTLSVTASLVADLFEVEHARLVADLRRALKRLNDAA
jgi:hypothetical protein